tara:strand:+ start:137 stop:718 length:582 start_codon:yes stop_codon:yes gene_type:complete
MIEFGCSSCGRSYRVSEDKAGKKAKCSDCGAVIQVPIPDNDELDFDEEHTLSYELLELREHTLALIASGYEDLLSCKTVKDDMLSIVIKCDESRKQMVLLHSFLIRDESHITVFSPIGNYYALGTNKEQFFQLVVDCSTLPIASIKADEDGDISVQQQFAALSLDESEILATTIHIGKHADFLEQKYFLADMH